VVFRAHPAFFDAESVRIALRDLEAAYAAIKTGREPEIARRPTDYAALALWEGSEAGRRAQRRFESRWPESHEDAANKSSTGLRRGETEPSMVLNSWSREDTATLDAVARRLGVTPCAVLLGCFALEGARLSDPVVITCPVSSRPALRAEGVIGPLATDVPLPFSRHTLHDVATAALAAAERIGALFDALPCVPRHAVNAAEGYRFGFTYLDPWSELKMPWGRVVRRAVLHAAPLWFALKLSATRKDGHLELRLRRDPSGVGAEADTVVHRIRERVLAWHRS
jgi:hypothetical protein